MDQVRYFRNHPQRCIAGFNSTPFALPGVDGHGMQINSVFALACTCGSGQHVVHGFSWINPDNFDNVPVFLSPLHRVRDADRSHRYRCPRLRRGAREYPCDSPWAWQPRGVRMSEVWAAALGSVCPVRISWRAVRWRFPGVCRARARLVQLVQSFGKMPSSGLVIGNADGGGSLFGHRNPSFEERRRPDARRLPGPKRYTLKGHSRWRSLPRLYVTSHSLVPPLV